MEVQCGFLTPPDNGSVVVTGYDPLDNATFTCYDGFDLNGTAMLQCQENGQWDGEEPTCIGETEARPSTEERKNSVPMFTVCNRR